METQELVDAYLARLGVDRETPSAEALARIHRAHIERVAWETLWIHCGETYPLDVVASAQRIAAAGRGGYCYHLNGALSWLLESLGYSVHRHIGGVHGPDGMTEHDFTNHLVLTVDDLSTDANPNGTWYVDAGTGDALHSPLPLVAGAHADGPFTVQLDAPTDGSADWHLTHHASGAFKGMGWRNDVAVMDDFHERHVELATAPDSRFVEWSLVQRRDATGVDSLRGVVLLRIGEHTTQRLIDSPDEYRTVLNDVFGIRNIAPATIRAVWEHASKRYEEHITRTTNAENLE